MAKLDGKVALITGAAAGLGEGISTAYAKYGAKLIMVDLSPDVYKRQEVCHKRSQTSERYRYFENDVLVIPRSPVFPGNQNPLFQ